MNFYELDGIELNGWATQKGAGSAAITLTNGGNAIIGKALAGTNALFLATNAVLKILGSMGGTATLTLANTGQIAGGGVMGGAVTLNLAASGMPSTVQYAGGVATLDLFAGYGLPNPPVIPGAYSRAHKNATLHVPRRQAPLVVPKEARVRDPRREQLPRPSRKRNP